jgi:two-component system response regulator AtoC
VQVKLLRVLEERKFERVGGEETLEVDVRIVAATNRDLPKAIAAGAFREDLFYRLHVVTLHLPPLRERRQDVPALVDHFLRIHAGRRDRGPIAIDPAAQAALLAHDWPGNVRELENVIERAVVFAKHDVVTVDDLPPEVRRATAAPAAPAGPKAPTEPLKTLEEVERLHVLRVLEAVGGNRDEAAAILGISRRTLTRMAQRWTLPDTRPRG